MSKKRTVIAFTSGRNILYGKPLSENKIEKVKPKKSKSILIKKNRL